MTDQTPRNLILILGDQLTPSLTALAEADPNRDHVLMAEVAEEAGYTNHHKQKLVLIFSAMRHFAAELEEAGWCVHYHSFDPDSLQQSLGQVVRATVESTGTGAWLPRRAVSGGWTRPCASGNCRCR